MNNKFLESVDYKILNTCSLKIKNNFLDWIMPKISRLNDYGMIYIFIALFSILRGYDLKTAINVIEALLLGVFIGEGLIKHFLRRKRPYFLNGINELLIKYPKTFSFPSGHTTSSFAVFGVLWLTNSQFKYVFLIIALLISFSRLYLYVHFPSDVFAGIVLGLLCSRIVISLSSNVHYVFLVNKVINHINLII